MLLLTELKLFAQPSGVPSSEIGKSVEIEKSKQKLSDGSQAERAQNRISLRLDGRLKKWCKVFKQVAATWQRETGFISRFQQNPKINTRSLNQCGRKSWFSSCFLKKSSFNGAFSIEGEKHEISWALMSLQNSQGNSNDWLTALTRDSWQKVLLEQVNGRRKPWQRAENITKRVEKLHRFEKRNAIRNGTKKQASFFWEVRQKGFISIHHHHHWSIGLGFFKDARTHEQAARCSDTNLNWYMLTDWIWPAIWATLRALWVTGCGAEICLWRPKFRGLFPEFPSNDCVRCSFRLAAKNARKPCGLRIHGLPLLGFPAGEEFCFTSSATGLLSAVVQPEPTTEVCPVICSGSGSDLTTFTGLDADLITGW